MNVTNLHELQVWLAEQIVGLTEDGDKQTAKWLELTLRHLEFTKEFQDSQNT